MQLYLEESQIRETDKYKHTYAKDFINITS